MPKGQLLKRWNDWSAGVGHLIDDGRTPGMYYSSGLLGLRGELRPAPVATDITDPGTGATYVTFSGSSAIMIGTACVRPASGTTVAFDAVSSGVDTDSVNTVSHVVTSSGSNRAIFVSVSSGGSSDPTGVTYAGDALTQVGTRELGTGTVSIWRKVNPTTGTNNIEATFSGAQDSVVGGLSFTNVDQSNPAGAFISNTGTIATDTASNADLYINGELIVVTKAGNVTATTAGDDTERWNTIANSLIRGVGATFSVGANNLGDGGYQVQYMFDDVATSDASKPFLYYTKGTLDGTNLGYWVGKVDIGNSSFGTGLSDAHKFVSGTVPLRGGQAARYKKIWRFPKGNLSSSGDLTIIGTGAISTDTLASSGTEPGDDHLTLLGHQLAGVVQDTSTNPGGARLLAIDGNPQTEADWGPVFEVGDKDSRPAGIRGLGGLAFVMNVEGLFSFNNKGRSALVFEDFREWRNLHVNIPLGAWRGGLVVPHPSGLMFFEPGRLPEHIGVDSKSPSASVSAPGVTELLGGIYHSTTTAGKYLYAIYQPDISSTTILALCAYVDPSGISWQALGKGTLRDLETMNGCYVSTLSRPDSANYATPTLWYQDAGTLTSTVLSGGASPFRSRADTHKVILAADAYMSELRFTEPVDLTEIIVQTSADMASGDEFQISLLVNGSGDDIDAGPPAKGLGTHHARTLDRKRVRSLVLHVEWAATSTSARVPPAIQSIELYGKPSVGEAE